MEGEQHEEVDVAAVPIMRQVTQDFDQDADGGDVDQPFNVSSSGNNSNQCVDITGNANIGNAQNRIDLIQYASDADDFDFEDTGANLMFTGSSTTCCDQQVNQAAAAGGAARSTEGGATPKPLALSEDVRVRPSYSRVRSSSRYCYVSENQPKKKPG
jgi:hypothetical protein